MKCKKQFKKNKYNGWGINLYRNPKKGYIGGVCAGLAEHFDLETWVVRLTFFAGLIFLQGFAFVSYLVLWFVLKPSKGEVNYEYEYDEKRHQYKPRKMFKYSDAAETRLKRARDRIRSASSRIENLERHVTSRKFDLEREFSSIKDK